MRLVLLPGLNGSSRLFAPLLEQLADIPCQVLELPQQGPQDHDSLAEALFSQLGDTPFVLLGESFSGPLAYRLVLCNPTGLQGLILAASFLQPPHPLTTTVSHLPLPSNLCPPAWLLRLLCLGDAPQDVLRLLQNEIRALPSELLRCRLQALARLLPPTDQLLLPTLHLWPQRDRLVMNQVAAGIADHCRNLRQERIEGPHFLLQSRPRACAQAIRSFMATLPG